MSHFIIQTASARMPSNVRSPYRHVAVLEVEDGVNRVKMISPRARGVVRVVWVWRNCNVGKRVRSAYARALVAARDMVDRLSAGGPDWSRR